MTDKRVTGEVALRANQSDDPSPIDCTVCGRAFGPECELALFDDPFGGSHVGLVCRDCLAGGPEAFGVRLVDQVHELESHARYLRELADRCTWVIPSLEDFDAAVAFATAR
jgi:hypothetical protein